MYEKISNESDLGRGKLICKRTLLLPDSTFSDGIRKVITEKGIAILC